MYNPNIGRWNGVDALAEKYQPISPFGFVENRPINNLEIDGRYFDKRNDRIASRIERRADRRANRLDNQATRLASRGQSTGDLGYRAAELRKSKKDIQDMRNNKTTEYRYARHRGRKGRQQNLVGPTTIGMGNNNAGHEIVTMFTENRMGSKLHESRHGGQNARGETQTNGLKYGVRDEIDAYRAEYSWNGSMEVIDLRATPTQAQILQALQNDTNPLMTIISNIHNITAELINNLAESDPQNGLTPIYPPAGIPKKYWDAN